MSPFHLLIDLGNSRLKWALATGGRLAMAQPAAQPWPAQPLPWQQWRAAGVATVVLASVAPEDTSIELSAALQRNLAVPVRRARVRSPWAGLTCAYPNPDRLGVDRWLALLAAHRLDPGNSWLVVSAGTALTIDRLDPGGRHRGGLIVPGLAAMRAGLLAAAPGLAPYDHGRAMDTLAIDSGDAIASGCLQATLALIERVRARIDAAATVLLAGGDAEQLAAHLSGSVVLEPRLVLQGLAIWSQVADDTPAQA